MSAGVAPVAPTVEAPVALPVAGRAPRRLVLRRWQLVMVGATIPALLAGVYVSTNVRASLAQRALRTQWASIATGATLDAAGLSTAAIAPGDPVARLVVNAAGIDLIVVEGSEGGEGSTHRGPVHRAETVRPGLPGIAVIEGGRFGYGNMFMNLARCVPGDVIVVETRAGPSRFRVTGVSIMPASALDAGSDAAVPMLLLVGPARAWGSTDRIVVRAEATEPNA